MPEVIDQLSYSSGDNGQVPNRQTQARQGNEQVVQVDSLYAREEGNLSDNGFHLSICPNVETFEGLDLDKRIDVLIRQHYSLGFDRQDIDFESWYKELKDEYLSYTGVNLSEEFELNLGTLEINGNF